MIHIPEKILLGFNRRDSYGNILKDEDDEHILGYATYKDDKGNIKSQKSWDNWRDQKVPPIEYYNELLNNFKIAGSVKRDSGWNCSGRSIVRIDDPRGFQLEINVDKLINLLYESTIENGIIKEKCVWAWDGAENILLSESMKLYNIAFENTKRKGMKVPLKEINIGDKVQLEDGTICVFYGGNYYLSKSYYHESLTIKRAYFFNHNNNILILSSPKISIVIEKNKESVDTNKELNNLWNKHSAHEKWVKDNTIGYNHPDRDNIKGTHLRYRPKWGEEILYSNTKKFKLEDVSEEIYKNT